MAATTAMATYHVELDITALEQLIQTQAALAADITLNAESLIALAQRIEALEEVRRISAFAGDVLARIEGLETLMRRHDIRITKAEERLENAESLTVNAMGAWGKAAPRLHAQGVRIEALESAQAELAEDVSNHGGRLQSVETRVEQVAGDAQATGWRQMMATRLMALEEAAQPHEVPLSPDPLRALRSDLPWPSGARGPHAADSWGPGMRGGTAMSTPNPIIKAAAEWLHNATCTRSDCSLLGFQECAGLARDREDAADLLTEIYPLIEAEVREQIAGGRR